MTTYLSSDNFPNETAPARQQLKDKLAALLQNDLRSDLFALLANYQRILADNQRRNEWPELHDKLQTMFKCGKAASLDGPMIGIPLCIRDSDFFRHINAEHSRSVQASLDVLGTLWNATFADSGLWMGKTFEPVSRAVFKQKCAANPAAMATFDEKITRIGRNFFREPPHPKLLQTLGLPTLTQAWQLKDRPATIKASGFPGILRQQNLNREKAIPYSKTGGYFLAYLYKSVVPGMQKKQVYGLNYRWDALHPAFPMTCLVDELVQVADGIYLGQLIYATQHFSLGTLDIPMRAENIPLGEAYTPGSTDYGYQNNGYFLMMNPSCTERIYADDVFPQLRPRRGESGYTPEIQVTENTAMTDKFTRLLTRPDQGDVKALRHEGESVLQMLQRISATISAQSNPDEQIEHFELLHRLFRAGIAPSVKHGLFQGSGNKGYNLRITGDEPYDWYGARETTQGFDYYHGATLNLHCGLTDNFKPNPEASALLPGILACHLTDLSLPNALNLLWHNIGKYIFPWAGKSFETLSPRKLSMLLDESADLAERYPERVAELKNHPASLPHYLAVKANACQPRAGRYAEHLTRSRDQGMSDEDKTFWQQETENRWLMGFNLQDQRILAADALMQLADMNYRTPDAVLQQASEASGSPFVRQGYAFLGVADQTSILPINQGRQVFQFHYRYPMIGGPAPIGYCLDELVEIADGLFLGQLIYATALHLPFHSATDTADYHYQLFGYFLLLDDEWERHRQAIGLDTLGASEKQN